MKRGIAIVVLFSFTIINCFSNDRGGELHPSVIFILELISTNIDEQNITPEYLEEYSEYLMQIINNPFDLNLVTHNQLSSLYIIDNIRILSFFHYRESYGHILSVNELKMIPGFDDESLFTILSPFLTVKSIDGFNKSDKQLRVEMISRFKMIYPKSVGYSAISREDYQKNPNSRFIGSPEYLSYRLKLDYKRYSLRLFLEKDPGELYFDMFKGNIKIDNIFKKSKLNILLGSYNARFAYGLVLWNGFKMEGNSSSNDIFINPSGISSVVASDKCSRFNGAVIELVPFRSSLLTVICSSERKDAIITDVGGYSSIIKTGHHARAVDLQRKGALNSYMCAINFRYDYKNLSLSYLLAFHKFSHIYDGKNHIMSYLLNKYGRVWSASSVSYKYVLNRAIFFGELAVDKSLSKSFVNSLIYRVGPDIELSIKYLHLDNLYYSPVSDIVRESLTGVDNLKAIITYKIDKRRSLSAAFNLSSSGYKVYFNYLYTDGVRVINIKSNLSKEALWLRLLWNNKILNDRLQIALRGDLSRSYCYNYHAYIDFNCKILSDRVALFLRGAFFSVLDWNARIYSYERDLLYLYTNFLNYGKGVRAYFFSKLKFNSSMDFWIKVGYTHYLDRVQIGEGPDKILGPSKFDFKFQIRYSM